MRNFFNLLSADIGGYKPYGILNFLLAIIFDVCLLFTYGTWYEPMTSFLIAGAVSSLGVLILRNMRLPRTGQRVGYTAGLIGLSALCVFCAILWMIGKSLEAVRDQTT